MFLDFLIEETLGVIVRRAKQRKSNPPDLSRVINVLRGWNDRGLIESTVKDLDGKLPEILDLVSESTGALNPNDAKIVMLQRSGVIWGDRNIGPGIRFVSRSALVQGADMTPDVFLRITMRPDQMGGAPCIRGLRIPVSVVIDMVASGLAYEQILDLYPDLEKEDITEVLHFAAAALGPTKPARATNG